MNTKKKYQIQKIDSLEPWIRSIQQKIEKENLSFVNLSCNYLKNKKIFLK